MTTDVSFNQEPRLYSGVHVNASNRIKNEVRKAKISSRYLKQHFKCWDTERFMC